jgi:flagellar basal body-associated protein FliL
MSEEQEQEGTWSGLKKTIIGVATTLVTAGGVWISTLLGGGDKEATPAPAAAPVINITNSNQQQQSAGGGTTKIIEREKVVEKPAPAPKPKKKEGDEFKEEAPKW